MLLLSVVIAAAVTAGLAIPLSVQRFKEVGNGPSTKSNEFYVGFLPNQAQSQLLALTITTDEPVPFNVTISFLTTILTNVTVLPYSSVSVTLPNNLRPALALNNAANTVEVNKGVYIRAPANRKVSVYGINAAYASVDTFVAAASPSYSFLSAYAYPYEYYMFSASTEAGTSDNPGFMVVAGQNNTEIVYIIPTAYLTKDIYAPKMYRGYPVTPISNVQVVSRLPSGFYNYSMILQQKQTYYFLGESNDLTGVMTTSVSPRIFSVVYRPLLDREQMFHFAKLLRQTYHEVKFDTFIIITITAIITIIIITTTTTTTTTITTITTTHISGSGQLQLDDHLSAGQLRLDDHLSAGQLRLDDHLSAGQLRLDDHLSAGQLRLDDHLSAGQLRLDDHLSAGQLRLDGHLSAGQLRLDDHLSAGQLLLDDHLSAGQLRLDDHLSAGQLRLDDHLSAGQLRLDDHLSAGQLRLDDHLSAGQLRLDDHLSAGQLRLDDHLSAGQLRLADHLSAVNQPAVNQPAVNQPAVNQPAVNQPAVNQPAVNQPAVNQPAVTTSSEPTSSEPTSSEPTSSEPTSSEPTSSEPTSSEPLLQVVSSHSRIRCHCLFTSTCSLHGQVQISAVVMVPIDTHPGS
eukprot:Em0010g53a